MKRQVEQLTSTVKELANTVEGIRDQEAEDSQGKNVASVKHLSHKDVPHVVPTTSIGMLFCILIHVGMIEKFTRDSVHKKPSHPTHLLSPTPKSSSRKSNIQTPVTLNQRRFERKMEKNLMAKVPLLNTILFCRTTLLTTWSVHQNQLVKRETLWQTVTITTHLATT